MVRMLAQTTSGVGLSPTQCYTFPCVGCFKRINSFIFYMYFDLFLSASRVDSNVIQVVS